MHLERQGAPALHTGAPADFVLLSFAIATYATKPSLARSRHRGRYYPYCAAIIGYLVGHVCAGGLPQRLKQLHHRTHPSCFTNRNFKFGRHLAKKEHSERWCGAAQWGGRMDTAGMATVSRAAHPILRAA